MKIEFSKDLEGYQSAQKLRLILGHCYSYESDQGALDLINSLSQQIETFLANPEFDKFRESTADTREDIKPDRFSIAEFLSSIWQFLAGPSHREMVLSRQRKELIERAEHAESIAFEALAETAEMSKDRNSVLKEMKELEQELAKLKGKI
jgi:hypothetical protein